MGVESECKQDLDQSGVEFEEAVCQNAVVSEEREERESNGQDTPNRTEAEEAPLAGQDAGVLKEKQSIAQGTLSGTETEEAPLTGEQKLKRANSPSAKLWEQVKRTYHLAEFTALPEYLRDNEFIHRGYRVDLTVKQAVMSIFKIHNETGNIWTHFIGFLLFLGLTIYTVANWPRGVDLPALPSFPRLPNLTGLGLPSLGSLESALPQLKLPDSLSSCFHSAAELGKDVERCIFAALRHLQLPESLSSCFYSGDAWVPGKDAAHCTFDALAHLQIPDYLSSCIVPADSTSLHGKDNDRCMFQNLGHGVMHLMAPFLDHPLPQTPITRWPFILFLCGAMICLLSSSTCHLLGCRSERFNSIVWRFDYAGIAVLIATSFYPSVYYAFLCDPITRTIYLVLVTVMGVATVMVSLLDKFQQPSYRVFRASLFVGMGLLGVVPTGHKLFFYWQERVVITTTLYEVGMGVFYSLGAIFYASRIPERWLPGKFDLAGHSHQIFHLLVIAGALTHYKTGLEYLKWRDMNGCPSILS